MKWLLFLISCFTIYSCSYSLKENQQPPYYQTQLLTTPIAFNEGEITTMNGIQFSMDGKVLYISKSLDRKFDNGKPYMGIFTIRFEAGVWTAPQLIELGVDSYHPVLSVKNDRLFFNSRSHLDSANKAIPHNIWVTHKTAGGWGDPEMVEGINSADYDSYPSIASSNNLYFNSNRSGGKGGMDIYVSYFINNSYQTPVNIQEINSENEENDLVVDPEERFIIFNRYIHATKQIDLFISFKNDRGWSIPQELISINKPEIWELTPTLSPDGQYFFFEVDGKIMQVDLAVILPSPGLE